MTTRHITFAAILGIITMFTCQADDYQDVISHDIIHLGRHPDLPVHAPSLIHTGTSFLAVHGFAKVGGKEGYGDIYRSTDGGKTWTHQCDLPTYYCGSFFQLGEVIYLLYGDFRHENNTKLRQSTDDGVTWSEPVVIYDQALWDGNGAWARRGGFLYKALDEPQPKGPSLPRVLKLSVDADPMQRENWTSSELPDFNFPPPEAVRDYQVENGQVQRNNNEGNCVVGPDGKLWVIYRHFERSTGMFSATTFYDDATNTQRFRNVYEPDPAKGEENCYSDFPGACNGFHIAFDGVSGKYIALSNPVTGETEYPNGKHLGIYRCMRNVLVMMESNDLVHWHIAKHLLKDGLEPTWEESVKRTGFQQINFQIIGDDLVWISRTAYDGARNLHDANRITFHRLADFRHYLNPDGEVAHYRFDDPEHLGKDTCKQAGPGTNGGNKATPVNVQHVLGKSGGAAGFSHADSKLDVKYRISTELHRAEAVTISTWVYLAELPPKGGKAQIVDFTIDKGFVGIGLGIADGQLNMAARSHREDACQILRVPAPATGAWYHLTAIYDFRDKTLELHIDGKLAKAQPAEFAEDAFLRGIPGERDTIGAGLKGRLDELQIHRRRVMPKETP